MPWDLVLIVLAAALAHAVWNAFVKVGGDALLAMSLIGLSFGSLALPVLPLVGWPDPVLWPWLVAAVASHFIYHLALARAYSHGDLSVIYPIARGTGPVIVALLAGPVAGDWLSGWELIGIAVIAGALMILGLGGRHGPGGDRAAILWALLTGLTIALYTLVDGLGVRAGRPFTFIAWLFFLDGWLFAAAVTWYRGWHPTLAFARRHWHRCLGGGAIAALGFTAVLWAIAQANIAYVATLRETSILFAALIGAFALKEPFGRTRIAAALAVVLGLGALRLVH